LAPVQRATLGCELFYALSARVGESDDHDHRFTDKYEQGLLDLRVNVDASNRESVVYSGF
jgi:hypothetical protein